MFSTSATFSQIFFICSWMYESVDAKATDRKGCLDLDQGIVSKEIFNSQFMQLFFPKNHYTSGTLFHFHVCGVHFTGINFQRKELIEVFGL